MTSPFLIKNLDNSVLSTLVFGGTGTLGSAVMSRFAKEGYEVLCVGRNAPKAGSGVGANRFVTWNPLQSVCEIPPMLIGRRFDSIVWCQGMNATDDIFSFERGIHEKVYEANVTYILQSLKALLDNCLLAENARLCILSSIWQELGRQQKLSYCVSKAAVGGLVRSLAIDLGVRGMVINAVLPGAVDSPMTRANLTQEQIRSLEEMTPLKSLATSTDVSNAVFFLCSDANKGITGQFFSVDRGFSSARIL